MHSRTKIITVERCEPKEISKSVLTGRGELYMGRIKKEGQQYGFVKVLKYAGAGKYECECQKCKNTYLIDTRNLGQNNVCRACYLTATKSDLTGQRFGRLIARCPKSKIRGKYQRTAWLCDCDCGKQIIVDTDSLVFGNTKSCGCINKERDLPDELRKEFIAGTQLSKIKSIPTKSNKTGVVGVNWDKSRSKWQASIRFQGKKIFLGRYENFDDAVKARKKAEKEYFENILKSTN